MIHAIPIGIAVIFLIAACSFLDSAPAITTALIFAALAGLLYKVPALIIVVRGNPLLAVSFTIGFFIAGALWSLVRWYVYNLDELERYLSLDPEPYGYEAMKFRKPKARDHKARIVSWIVYWPLSVLKFLLGNVVTMIAKRIYQLLARQYDEITNHVFRDHPALNTRD